MMERKGAFLKRLGLVLKGEKPPPGRKSNLNKEGERLYKTTVVIAWGLGVYGLICLGVLFVYGPLPFALLVALFLAGLYGRAREGLIEGLIEWIGGKK